LKKLNFQPRRIIILRRKKKQENWANESYKGTLQTEIYKSDDNFDGRDRIDGIDVEGIEVYALNLCTASFIINRLVAQLWVDVETNLPVLLKAEINGAKGEKAILKPDTFPKEHRA
jgi:hypothetical protein